ncbi:MAG: hypothetical protein FJX71_04195 [Alphaproteobacteria bacterium]|nr:hypothetical protein [Alphaproteobacteria bacterium]
MVILITDQAMEALSGGVKMDFLGNGNAVIYESKKGVLTQDLNGTTDSIHALTWKGDSDGNFDLNTSAKPSPNAT